MGRFTSFVIMAIVFLEPWLVALWIAVGSGRQRRSHFWVRGLLAALALPALMAALVGIARQRVLPLPDHGAGKELLTLLFLVGVIALMFVPGLLYRPSDASPGSSESDDGGAVRGRNPPRPIARSEAFRFRMLTGRAHGPVTTTHRNSVTGSAGGVEPSKLRATELAGEPRSARHQEHRSRRDRA